jgi:hypothetical protein
MEQQQQQGGVVVPSSSSSCFVWGADQPPLNDGLMAEARWFGGYALQSDVPPAGGVVRLGLAPHCPHRARPPALPSLYRYVGGGGAVVVHAASSKPWHKWPLTTCAGS